MRQIFGGEALEPKRFYDGTERTRSPAETLTRFSAAKQHVGITRLANVTGLDRIGIPVVMAVRPNARSLAVSQGKGIDLDAARASAMMESIELWHAEHIVAPLRHESYLALSQDSAMLDLEQIPLRPRAQLRRDVGYEWIAGEDLGSGVTTWVPFEAVSMNTVIASDRVRTFSGTTNGLASGNELLEATVHGLLELIERDAVSLFHQQLDPVLRRRRIILESVTDSACAGLLAKLARARFEIALWDVTSDIDVPVYFAAIADPDDRTTGIFRGYGAHLTATVAMARAITEAAQSRLTIIAGSRDDNLPGVYIASRELQQRANQYQYYFSPPATTEFAAVSLATSSFNDDLSALLIRLRAVGIEQVVGVPLSQLAVGVPVVKVFAPSLESYVFAPGYRPGARAHRYCA